MYVSGVRVVVCGYVKEKYRCMWPWSQVVVCVFYTCEAAGVYKKGFS